MTVKLGALTVTTDDQSEELTAQADELLRHTKLDRSRPAYTTATLERRQRLLNTREASGITTAMVEERNATPHIAEMLDAIREDFQRLADKYLRDAGYARDYAVFSLDILGCTQEQIATALDMDQTTVSRRIHAAKARISRHWVDCPWWGWYEVYISEVRRGGE